MAVNYDDERLTSVQAEEEKTLNENNEMYNNMIQDSQDSYNAMIEASQEWAEKQSAIQQENTDFTIEQIEQQKEQAERDYLKEQSGAYADWQKQSNRYGVNAEQMAQQGFVGSGYSESAQVSMYNTYQNRVATARASFEQITLNYNNAMKEAQLQNNSNLAQIAIDAQKQQLELMLQQLQYKNTLLETQANKKLEIKNQYHSRYQDVLAQINQEKALAEQIRQYNASLAEEKRQYNASLEEEKRQYNESIAAAQEESSGSGTTGKFGNSSATMARTDYYFSNGYQPRYVNDALLSKTGQKVSDVFGNSFGEKIGAQNIWKASDGCYYIWDGTSKDYVDVTSAFPSDGSSTGGVYSAYFK